MSAPQGTFSFPAIEGVLSASVTVTNGISPSITSVTIEPKPGMPRLGAAVWSCNGVPIRSFPNSVIQGLQVSRQDGRTTWQLAIADRRWMWANGQISGEYNVPGDGGVIESTKKSPRELAELCLQAMDETGFDVSALPDTGELYVNWEVEVPAKALADVCDNYGCTVALLPNNTVRVVRIGDGAALPGGALAVDETVEPANMPSQLIVLSAPVRWQLDFPLEAVGREEDGEIKPINDLSYTPADGWEKQSILDFGSIPESDRENAKESVYRWYRIRALSEGEPITELPDAVIDLEEEWQVLPVYDEFVTKLKSETQESNEKAIVWGRFHDAQGAGGLNIETPVSINSFNRKLRNEQSHVVDAEIGVVKFSEPVSFFDPNPAARTGEKPGELFIRCSVNLRDKDTRELQRMFRSVVVDPTSPSPPKYLVRDDLIPRYLLINRAAGTWVDNREDIENQMDDYLEEELANFLTFPGASAQYAGFVFAENDGAIRQITYRIANGAATTEINRNTERPDRSTPHGHARFLEKSAEETEKARRRRRSPLQRILRRITRGFQ